MNKRAVPLQGMYQLINPDPLLAYSLRELAESAGVSKSTVQRLRTDPEFQVSASIAKKVSKAAGVQFDRLFRAAGRKAWR